MSHNLAGIISSFLERTLVYWGGESSSWWFIFSKDLKLLHVPPWLFSPVIKWLWFQQLYLPWTSKQHTDFQFHLCPTSQISETVSTVRFILMSSDDSQSWGDSTGQETQGYFLFKICSLCSFEWIFIISCSYCRIHSVQLYKWKLLLVTGCDLPPQSWPTFPSLNEWGCHLPSHSCQNLGAILGLLPLWLYSTHHSSFSLVLK